MGRGGDTSAKKSLQHNQENTQYKTTTTNQPGRAVEDVEVVVAVADCHGWEWGEPARAAGHGATAVTWWVGGNTSEKSRKQLHSFHPLLMLTVVALQPPGCCSRGVTHTVCHQRTMVCSPADLSYQQLLKYGEQ